MTQPGEAVKDVPVSNTADLQAAPGFGRLDRRSSEQARGEFAERDAHHSAPDPEDLVSPGIIRLLTVTFGVVVILAIDVLLSVWPSGAAGDAGARVAILWGAFAVTVTANDRLMLIAILMGVIGALVHVMTSFTDFVGNKRLEKSWLPWYFLRPAIGAGLSLFFYVGLRAGLLTASAADGNIVNPFGIAAIGGLAGMFSKQAADKLNEVFSLMFKASADDKRGGKLGPTAPTRPVATTTPAPSSSAGATTTNTGGSAS
jgi:hypothetical protein